MTQGRQALETTPETGHNVQRDTPPGTSLSATLMPKGHALHDSSLSPRVSADGQNSQRSSSDDSTFIPHSEAGNGIPSTYRVPHNPTPYGEPYSEPVYDLPPDCVDVSSSIYDVPRSISISEGMTPDEGLYQVPTNNSPAEGIYNVPRSNSPAITCRRTKSNSRDGIYNVPTNSSPGESIYSVPTNNALAEGYYDVPSMPIEAVDMPIDEVDVPFSGNPGRARILSSGYMIPRQLQYPLRNTPPTQPLQQRHANYDFPPPPKPAILSPQHKSILLQQHSTEEVMLELSRPPRVKERSISTSAAPSLYHDYVNVSEFLDMPPPIDRSTKPPVEAPPIIDRATKPGRKASESQLDFPDGATPDQDPVEKEDPFTSVDVPRLTSRSIKYIQINFDKNRKPIPVPRAKVSAQPRTNYCDVDMVATSTMVNRGGEGVASREGVVRRVIRKEWSSGEDTSSESDNEVSIN